MSIIDEEIQDWCAHNSHLDTHILCGGTNGIEDESPEKDDNRSSEYRQVHQVFFERANFQHMSSTGSTNAGLIENSMALDSNHKHRQAQGQGAPPSDNAG
ncbi:hypothetical protein RUM43_007058 [Polyplax serrata]|uniref:Uncharacterized protein n=1 Tax=Polyplax serrata TaxID=468196 RepID=A0AAN8P580_POLSC